MTKWHTINHENIINRYKVNWLPFYNSIWFIHNWQDCELSRTMIDHYDDVTMSLLASHITSLTIVYPIVYSGVDQRKHQSSASRGPVNSPAQMASNAEKVSIWWRHHGKQVFDGSKPLSPTHVFRIALERPHTSQQNNPSERLFNYIAKIFRDELEQWIQIFSLTISHVFTPHGLVIYTQTKPSKNLWSVKLGT